MAFQTTTLTFVLGFALLACGGHTLGSPSGGGGRTSNPEPPESEVNEPEDTNIVKVSVRDQSACTLRGDGKVACFTFKDGFESASAPVAGKFRDIAGSATQGAALREDGSVATWGDTPPRFPEGPFAQIAFDYGAACGIKTDGSIACSGTTESITLAGDFRQLQVAGNGGVCGLTADGALHCRVTPAWYRDPPLDLPPLREFSIDPSGEMGGCGIDLAGALHCWDFFCPVAGTFSHVAISYLDACATTINGELQCWDFRLAPNDCTSPSADLDRPSPPTGTFTVLASWLLKRCAIEALGDRVQCW